MDLIAMQSELRNGLVLSIEHQELIPTTIFCQPAGWWFVHWMLNEVFQQFLDVRKFECAWLDAGVIP
jgi:hypothetical protein